jgi:hypothetical protein
MYDFGEEKFLRGIFEMITKLQECAHWKSLADARRLAA